VPEGLSGVGISASDGPTLLTDAIGYRSRPRSPRAFSDAELGRLLDSAIAGDLEAAAAL